MTIRLAESTGLGSRAGLTSPVLQLDTLTRSDLLERPSPTTADPHELTLTGFEIATYLAATPPPAAGQESARTTERAQPVYSRYWLHNKGPAPLGYLPISIALTPGLVTSPEGPFEVEVVLASHLTNDPHEGVVDIRVPDGWTATPSQRPFRLPPSGHLRFPVTITPAPAPGLSFVSARTSAGGQLIEDITTVAIGDLPELPVTDQPSKPGTAIRGTKSTGSRPTGLSLETPTDALSLRPGERASLTLRLTNTTSDEIRGESQLASPWGTWTMLPEVIQGFTVAAGEAIDVTFPVEVPADQPPGHSWALAKVMWFGRCQYSPAIRLEVTR